MKFWYSRGLLGKNIQQMCVLPCHLWDPDIQEGLGIPEVQPLPACDEKRNKTKQMFKLIVVILGPKEKNCAYVCSKASDLTEGKRGHDPWTGV